jgi:hypothetical protein
VAGARRHLPLLLLLAATALLHGRAVRFPFVNWDDPTHVYRNRAVVAPGELTASERWLPRHLGYPMPVVIASYRADRALFGPTHASTARLEQGRGYHLTNLVLALILVTLVHLLLRRALSDAPRARWFAAFGAALLVLHPAAVEPIVWVSGRKDLLVAIGCVGATILWLRLIDDPAGASPGRAVAFVGAGLLALASKPTAVMLLPFAAWSLTRGPRPRTPRAHLLAWSSLALLAVAAALVVALSLDWQRSAGALAPLAARDTARQALWALGYHLQLLFWPVDLRAKYLVDPGGLGAHDLIALLGIAGAAALLLHRRTRGGAAALGVAFAVAAYLPQSNLIPLQRQLADSYLFLPLVGISLCAAAGLRALCERRPAFSALALLLAPLAILAWRQVGFWRSSEHLWERVQRYHPDNAIVCRMLGEGQIEAGQPARAIATYQTCVARFGLAPYANNLAIAYYLVGDAARARATFRWILARRPGDPRALKYLRRLESTPARR